MKGLEFAILNMGMSENDRAWNICMPNPASVTDRSPAAEMMKIPFIAILVKHPDIGYVMFDCGGFPGDEYEDGRRRTAYMSKYFPVYMTRDDFLDRKLSTVGLTIDDIGTVVCSHMHWDHCGGVGFFSGKPAGQNVYAPKADFQHALVLTHKGGEEDHIQYLRQNFEFPNVKYNLIEEDFELAPGIRFVMLEGHAPSILGMVLECEEHNYIFPSDAVFTSENYGPPVIPHSEFYDSLGFYRTIRKLNKLEKQLDAKLIFPHDYKQFVTYKTSHFYK